jgi:hypothetical protein
MSDTPATISDLVHWQFHQIGTFTWDAKEKTMAIQISDTANPPATGIYGFVLGGVVCRVGVSETDLIARVLWRAIIVTAFHHGDRSKGLGVREANRWLERLTAHPEGGTVWARAGTPLNSFLGEIDGSLAEERHFIKTYKPYMNTARN